MAFSFKKLNFLIEGFHNLTDEKKRQLVLLCTAAVVFILVLSVIISILTSGGKENPQEEPVFQRTEQRIVIPPEDIFFPDEPDFIPGVLPGRERRTAWSEEDAKEFWHDPLRQGEEIWRIRIEEAIDELLERIP